MPTSTSLIRGSSFSFRDACSRQSKASFPTRAGWAASFLKEIEQTFSTPEARGRRCADDNFPTHARIAVSTTRNEFLLVNWILLFHVSSQFDEEGETHAFLALL